MKLWKFHVHKRHVFHLSLGLSTAVLLLAILPPIVIPSSARAALLQQRSVQLSDPTAGVPDVGYVFGFSTNTSGPIGSITFEICTNYLYNVTDVCDPPPGLDAAGTSLGTTTGVTDFTLLPPISPNKLVLTRTPAPVSPQAVSYEFTDIVNPQDIGSYYVHIATFASTDGTGPEIDHGDVVFTTNLDINITTEVPPYLQFCTGITIDGYNCGTAQGSFLSFGELSAAATRAATSQMLASTNAAYGYSITLAGSTMTSGNNAIPAMSGGPSVVGSSQFGLNARVNGTPSVGAEPDGPGLTMPTAPYNSPNNYRFNSGDIVASSSTTDDYRKLTVSYIVNRSRAQEPGRYVATVSYICLANF